MGHRRAAHVAWRRVGDETVLIHLRTKKLYVLNPSGGFFWHRLDGGDVESFLEDLRLDEPLPEEAFQQVDTFLRALSEADLVESREEGERSSTGPNRAPDYPSTSFVPPELVWQEELRNFGQSCAFVSGSSAACDAVPTM